MPLGVGRKNPCSLTISKPMVSIGANREPECIGNNYTVWNLRFTVDYFRDMRVYYSIGLVNYSQRNILSKALGSAFRRAYGTGITIYDLATALQSMLAHESHHD